MNKKILIFGVLTTLMLVTISFATAIQTTNTDKKESPLYGIRTRLAIGEKIQNLKETIKTRFIGDRLFFLPFKWQETMSKNVRNRLNEKSVYTDPCGFSVNAVTCKYYLSCYLPAGCQTMVACPLK